MTELLRKIRKSLARDAQLPLTARVAKGMQYLLASATAPLYLRDVTTVGSRARTLKRPLIDNRGRLEIGDDLTLNSVYAATELSTDAGALLRIGHRVGINYGVSISARARVTIGSDVSVGPYSLIHDCDSGPANGASGVATDAQPIEIGDGVWLAARVTVLPGARIGARSVITAGSIVEGEIPEGVVAGGIPIRVLRRLDESRGRENGALPHASGNGALASSTIETPARGAPMDAGTRTPVVATPTLGNVSDERPTRTHAPSVVVSPTSSLPQLRGVVLADFTIGDLDVRLRGVEDQPSMIVTAAPYGQVTQSLLQAPPADASDFAIVWTRPESVSAAFQAAADSISDGNVEPLHADVDALCDVILSAASSFRMILVPTWTIPSHCRGLGMLDTKPGGLTWALTAMNGRLMDRLSSSPNVFVLNAGRWRESAAVGPSAERAWYLGKVAFHGELLAEAVRDMKAAARGLLGHARKLLVLDLDDTLWGGIVGDVGWENLTLGGHDPEGEAFVDFQRAVKALTRRGVILGIVSKNTESVALEALRQHPEMLLRPDDFVGWRINWQDKAQNISDLAAALNLGLQSVVFIDDNPVERARVRETLPEVLVPEWPENKLLYRSELQLLRCFDVPAISREDVERTRLYASERERDVLRQSVGSLDDWLKSLDIHVRIEALSPANLTRAAQLFNKTNQMNLATRRLTEQELVRWSERDGCSVWTVHVSDRFGDAGLTGILGLEVRDDTCQVVDFILSCRVMGRRVEECMASIAVACARQSDVQRVVADFLPTRKNAPCLAFWERSGFAQTEGQRFEWTATDAYPPPACIRLTREP